MSTRSSLKSFDAQRIFRILPVIPLFIFVLDFREWHQSPGAISSLPSNTEPEDELEAGRMLFPAAISTFLLNESFDGDVEDEPLPELAENHGTTKGTKLSVLQIILFPSLVNRGF